MRSHSHTVFDPPPPPAPGGGGGWGIGKTGHGAAVHRVQGGEGSFEFLVGEGYSPMRPFAGGGGRGEGGGNVVVSFGGEGLFTPHPSTHSLLSYRRGTPWDAPTIQTIRPSSHLWGRVAIYWHHPLLFVGPSFGP